MATLLDGVNEVLKRVAQIDNDTGLLSSLTDSAKQSQIDVTVQLWNEVVDDLYLSLGKPAPKNMAEDSSSVVLVQDQRAYTLPTDLRVILWPLIDETNGREIVEYPGGYMQMVEDQLIPDNYEGVPLAAAIRPTDGKLYVDTNPGASEAGLTYKLRYLKDMELTASGDDFPFNDAVFRSLVPAVAELFKYEKHNRFSDGIYRRAIGKAARLMHQKQKSKSWYHKGGQSHSNTDPLEE